MPQLLEDIADFESSNIRPKSAKASQKDWAYLGEAAYAVDSNSGMLYAVKSLLDFCILNKEKLVVFTEHLRTMDMVEYLLTSPVCPSPGALKQAYPLLHDQGLPDAV